MVTERIGAARPAGLLGVRSAARAVLEAAGVIGKAGEAGEAGEGGEGWTLEGISRSDARKVNLVLADAEGIRVSLDWSEPGQEGAPSFVAGPRHAVGYRRAPGAWDLDSAATPSEVKRRAVRACQALAALEAPVGVHDPEPAAPGEGDPEIPLTPQALERELAPLLPVGGELAGGWILSELHAYGPSEVALVFERPGSDYHPRVTVGLSSPESSARFRTRQLAVSYRRAFGASTDPDRVDVNAQLAAEVCLVLDSVDRGRRFVAPPRAETPEVAAPLKKAMNLAIPGDCGFDCAFCSVREEVAPLFLKTERTFVERLAADIRRSAAAGVSVLRINGIEPLNAPYLFELLEVARESGFEEYHLLSTCRPLCDRGFAERFIAAMPARYRIYAPIYGASAPAHDAVTGAPGSFDDLMRAVGHLRELMGKGGELIFTTVLIRANADQLTALADLVRPLGRWWEVHLAFPSTSSVKDRYGEVALSMSEALDLIYPKDWWPIADLPLGEILPCIALAHQRRTGHALLTPKRLRERLREPAGTFYTTAGFEHSLGRGAFSAATTPCPHRQACALASVCPGKVYTLYQRQHGLAELAPVSRGDLQALADGDEILAELP